MSKKDKDALKWIIEQETHAMRGLKGMRVSQAEFGMLGLDIVFNDQLRLILSDGWKILNDGKIKFGSGDVAKVFDDPGMRLWKDEEKRVRKRVASLRNQKCTGVSVSTDELSFRFTNKLLLVAHRVHESPRFWLLQKTKGDKEFSWWGPVFEGTG